VIAFVRNLREFFYINISDQKIKGQKIQEIGLIAQEKLSDDKEFSTVVNYLETDNFQNILDEKIFIIFSPTSSTNVLQKLVNTFNFTIM
jgi:hypothetical protein